MNGAFLHLAFNHIPVLGVPFCLMLLLAGLLRKSRDLVQAGFVGLILVALLTIVAFKTGGPAAHVVRDLPGVTRADIHEHAKAADFAFWGMNAVAVLALVGLGLSRFSNRIPGALTTIVLLGTLVLSVIFARVAHLGGLIRHPEIRSDYAAPAEQNVTGGTPSGLPVAR